MALSSNSHNVEIEQDVQVELEESLNPEIIAQDVSIGDQESIRLIEPEQQAAQNEDREFVEFQLNVLLSLRRKNLAAISEQVQKEQNFLDKIILAEQSVQNNKVKLEAKLKAERQSLQNQMTELE